MQRPKNLKIGEKFRVIEGDGYFNVGEIISLKEDDDSDCPYFWRAGGSDWDCINFSKLEPYAKTIRDAQVGDVVVGCFGKEHMVLERGQSTVLLSCGNNFRKAIDTNHTFDELEEYYTLKAAPVVADNVVLTMNEIAEKFGVDVSTLKIAKE